MIYKMRKLICLLLLASGHGFGQPAQSVNQVLGPPPLNWVSLYYCGTGMTACATGNTNVTAICMAPAVTSAPTVYAIGGTPSLTNIVVSTNVGTITFGAAAQFWVGQRLTVTGSTTALLNGTYRVNTVSGSTVTITTVGVADATYNNAAMTVSTSAPLLNALLWSIQIFTYTNSSVNAAYFAGAASFQINQGLACSARTTY